MTNRDRHFLCHLDELTDSGSTGVRLTLDGAVRSILVVHARQQVYGYINSCPHTGAPLDWTPGRFLTADKRFIQCATHAALFRIEDGGCIEGPCAGDRLTAVRLTVETGKVYLLTEPSA